MKKLILIVMVLVLTVFLTTSAIAFPAKDVYKKSSPAVVLIVASTGGGGGSLVGAGSIITREGLVVTNAHVVINDDTKRPYKKINVFTRPDIITGDLQRDLKYNHKAKVLAFDRDLDLALVQVYKLRSGTGLIQLADPKEIMVGEEVVAIGHPEQGGLWTLTYGRISTHLANQGNIKGKNVYQTDTSVNRGNSGGPLLDERGFLVGVNTNIARTGAGGLTITGVNFALKSDVVTSWLRRAKGLNIAYGKSVAARSESVAANTNTQPRVEVAPQQETTPVVERPVQSKPVVQEQVKKPVVQKPVVKKPVIKKPVEKPIKSDTILTPKRPYTEEDLYKQVEMEMMDMMDDMKGDFQKKKRKLR